MVVAGIVVDLIFAAFGLIPAAPRSAEIVHARIVWNYSSWLDLIALLVFGGLVLLHIRARRENGMA